MNLKQYFSIGNCSKADTRKIQLSVLLIMLFGFFIVPLAPLEYLFEYLDYGYNNGCPLLTITGLPCPTCGWGRSVRALLTLNSEKIFYYNPSAVIISIVAVAILLFIFILSLFKRKIILNEKSKKLWIVFVIAIVIIWLLNLTLGHHRTG